MYFTNMSIIFFLTVAMSLSLGILHAVDLKGKKMNSNHEDSWRGHFLLIAAAYVDVTTTYEHFCVHARVIS